MIKICTPIYSDITDQHKLSLVEMTNEKLVDFEYVQCRSCLPALARNTMVNEGKSTLIKQQLTSKYSHYLFIDYDIEWTSEVIIKLLSLGLPIVSGAYVSRSNNRCYQAGAYSMVAGNPGDLIPLNAPKGIYKVSWVGAGFLLVSKEALEVMEYPWFRHVTIPYMHKREDGMIECHQFECNEDVGFCMVSKAAGMDVYVDTSAFVNHNCEASVPPLQMTKTASHFYVGKQPFLIQGLDGKTPGEGYRVPYKDIPMPTKSSQV